MIEHHGVELIEFPAYHAKDAERESLRDDWFFSYDVVLCEIQYHTLFEDGLHHLEDQGPSHYYHDRRNNE